MNVLAQVAAFLRICFVGSRQPFECGTKLVQGVLVEAILICLSGQNRFLSSLNQGSRRTSKFLTGSNGRFCWVRILWPFPTHVPDHSRSRLTAGDVPRLCVSSGEGEFPIQQRFRFETSMRVYLSASCTERKSYNSTRMSFLQAQL